MKVFNEHINTQEASYIINSNASQRRLAYFLVSSFHSSSMLNKRQCSHIMN